MSKDNDTKSIQDLSTDVTALFPEKMPSIDFIDKLKSENLVLKKKVKQLEGMLMSSKDHLLLKAPPAEERICIKQIELLNQHSMMRELTLEEVKKLDFLVKNLKILQKSNETDDKKEERDVSESDLLALVSEDDNG
jgi:hypothetical protein